VASEERHAAEDAIVIAYQLVKVLVAPLITGSRRKRAILFSPTAPVSGHARGAAPCGQSSTTFSEFLAATRGPICGGFFPFPTEEFEYLSFTPCHHPDVGVLRNADATPIECNSERPNMNFSALRKGNHNLLKPAKKPRTSKQPTGSDS
jgi:hypothetical protein